MNEAVRADAVGCCDAFCAALGAMCVAFCVALRARMPKTCQKLRSRNPSIFAVPDSRLSPAQPDALPTPD